jgi:hypothetical protein
MATNQRMSDIKRTGCIPCLLENFLNAHAEIHHIVDQAYRKGDHRSYGNCSWHHRGIPWDGLQAHDMEPRIGPSMRLNSKAYHDRYGSELDLLQVQDFVLGLFDREPWGDHDMPPKIGRRVREFWTIVRNQGKIEPLVPCTATTV